MSGERFLIVMPNWFGETLFATPFLGALRAAFPQAFIAALGVARCEEVLAEHPHLDEFLLYDEQRIHRTVQGKRALIALIRSKRFSAAFVLRKSLTRTVMLAFAGVPRRIGFNNPKSGWLLTDRVAPPIRPMHKAETYLRLLEPLGVVGDMRPYQFDLSQEERAQARRLWQELGVADDQPLTVLHPGANWFHKRWPAERFAELGDRLAQQPGCAIAITGGPDDGPLVQAMRERMTAATPVVLAGRTTLRQLAACLGRADLVVSNDTGVLHVASAMRRPVVALYGPTSPAITGPLGDPALTTVIHHADCCPEIPCYRPEHPSYPGMQAIIVDEVYLAARQLLEAKS